MGAGAGDADACMRREGCRGGDKSCVACGDSSGEFKDASSCREHVSVDCVLLADCAVAWKRSGIKLNEGAVGAG